MPTRLVLCACVMALIACSAATASILTVGGPLSVKIGSDEPVVESAAGPLVRGAVTLSPHPIRPACDRVVFYLDEEAVLTTEDLRPELVLDTRKLADGRHVVRIEAERDGKMVVSSGSATFFVGNEEGAAVLDNFLQVPDRPSPPYGKWYRVPVHHGPVWVDGEEADLERAAFIRERRMYITLNDLMRHIGGSIVWGPGTSQVEVRRNEMTVRFIPGSSNVVVDGRTVSLGHPVLVRGGVHYVPVRPVCELFGIPVEWDYRANRAYVYTPQPSYSIARRDYPWISPVTGDPVAPRPGALILRNLSSSPIHVRLQGNAFKADWQIGSRATLSPVFVAAGTYQITVWSRQGEDWNDFITVVPDVTDRYEIGVHNMTLIPR